MQCSRKLGDCMPFGNARYGANFISYTLADPGVITVDSTQFFNIGDQVRVANVVCNGKQLNGDYLITDMTNNTLTINQDTTLFGTYVSGGFVTILQEANPRPSNQSNFYQEFIPWTVFNQAIGGGYIPYI
jgi:hypothetical protein